MKAVKLSVKDVTWTFQLLTDEAYEAKHGKDSHGITTKYTLEVDLKLSSFSYQLVLHELFHAYVASCCINSIEDMDDSAMEELAAEIIEYHIDQIQKNAKKIYTTLKPKELKKPKDPKHE